MIDPETAAIKEQLRHLCRDVDMLLRLVRDGNGSSLVSRVLLLEEQDHRSRRWQDRAWGWIGTFAIAFLLGVLMPRVQACDRITTSIPAARSP